MSAQVVLKRAAQAPVVHRFVLNQEKGLTQFTRDMAQESTLTFWKTLGKLSKVESKDVATFAQKHGITLRSGKELTFFNKLTESIRFMFSKFKGVHQKELKATNDTFSLLAKDIEEGIVAEPSKRGVKHLVKILNNPTKVKQLFKALDDETISPYTNSNVRKLFKKLQSEEAEQFARSLGIPV